MKIKRYIITIPFLLLFAVCCISACDDKEDSYKKYIPDGKAVYLGKAHSVQASPGNKRLELSCWLSADPQVKKVKVFWNSGSDSLEIPVDNKGEPQEIKVLIDNLDERKYLFEIFTYDNRGNRSLPVEVSGEAFGDSYIHGLINRALASIELMNGEVYLSWESLTGSSQTGMPIGIELNYTNLTGNDRKTIVNTTDMETVLSDIKPGSEVRYRTMYLPDSLAIDTFYSVVDVKDVPLYSLLDKTKFRKVVLPTDNTTQYNATYPMESLWDGSTSSIYYTGKNSGVPTWFTFDLGHAAKLKRVLYNQRKSPASVIWSNHNPRYFEIWGTAETPNPDGSWTGWVKLMDVESVKPSGLPPGENTAEDLAVVESGEEFEFPSETPSARYLRIKVNETWNQSQSIHIAELTFWEE